MRCSLFAQTWNPVGDTDPEIDKHFEHDPASLNTAPEILNLNN